jgi:hypothetical protein
LRLPFAPSKIQYLKQVFLFHHIEEKESQYILIYLAERYLIRSYNILLTDDFIEETDRGPMLSKVWRALDLPPLSDDGDCSEADMESIFFALKNFTRWVPEELKNEYMQLPEFGVQPYSYKTLFRNIPHKMYSSRNHLLPDPYYDKQYDDTEVCHYLYKDFVLNYPECK